MTRRGRRVRIAITVLGLVLASILVFLYIRTQGGDDATYYQTVVTLRQLKLRRISFVLTFHGQHHGLWPFAWGKIKSND